jgi:hypothetical protein
MNNTKYDAIYNLLLELKNDVITLNTKHDKLSAEFGAYTKRQSDIQEDSATIFLMKQFSTYLKQFIIYKSSLDKIYMPDNDEEFTDFDGCIILSRYNVKIDPHNLFNKNTRKNNLLSAQQKIQVPNDLKKENEIAVVVECKHGLTKSDIHIKLIQMYKFKNTVLAYKNGIITKQSNKFKKMANDNNLASFPDILYIVFSANDLSPLCETYINSINNGLDMKTYDDAVMPEITKLYSSFLKNPNIPNTLKKQLQNAKSSNDIYDMLTNYSKIKGHIFNTILPYKLIKPILDTFTQKIGIHRFNEINIPNLFTSTNFQAFNI